MSDFIKDSEKTHWVNRSPDWARPYLQLSRLDRPVGYWLLTLPGWIGLAFASLSHTPDNSDFRWALLILIGAVAMRGAGCTYNDIVDKDLDAQVERTALRPLPAGTVSTKNAWVWLFIQCFIGLQVLLALPPLAQYIALGSIPLVAAYPFMKRITWWPQLWLGFTFNWAVLVAYAAKTGTVSLPLILLYIGLVFWTVGYDTVYACQDIEDDAMVGIKSTARRFGDKIKLGLALCYTVTTLCLFIATVTEASPDNMNSIFIIIIPSFIFALKLQEQIGRFEEGNPERALQIFKSNVTYGFLLTLLLFGVGVSLLDLSG